LVDCSGSGCNGGWPVNALNYLAQRGSLPDWKYPYRAKDQSCRTGGLAPRAAVYNVREIQGEWNMAAAVSGQVIAFCIHGGNGKDFSHYHSGVFDGNCGSTNVGHAMAIVGYAPRYWIIRNSWGRSWGKEGHMYFQRGSNHCSMYCSVTAAAGPALAQASNAGSGSSTQSAVLV